MMPRRLILASILALPFIWVGVWAYAQWEAPNDPPPTGNLPGPVWLQTAASTIAQAGKINISGTVMADLILGSSASGDAIFGLAGSIDPSAAGVRGQGAGGDPSTGGGSWAGYFDGYLAASKFCTIIAPVAPSTTPTYDCSGAGATSNLWSQEGTTNNIFKTTVAGIVGIGVNTPGTTYPTDTKLGISGDGARIYLDGLPANTKNPEINFKLSSGTNDHWSLYADEASRQFRFWVKEASTSTYGRNALALSSDGVMIFPGWGNFAALTVTKTGAGTVTSSDANINCGSVCSFMYNIVIPPTSVVLTATPDSAGAIITWGGGVCSGTSATCNLTMDSAKNVTVSFSKPALTVNVSGSGTVSRNPSGVSCGTNCWEYDLNTNVTLTAAPTSGYLFNGWSGACTGTGSCALTMNSDKTVTASFIRPTLTVTVTGSGQVTSTPSGINSCSNTTCTATFDANTQVGLKANYTPAGQVAIWGGACSGPAPIIADENDPLYGSDCILTMIGNKTATVEFLTPAAPIATTSKYWSSVLNPKGRYDYTLNGSVKANGLSTSVSFRYGVSNVACASLPNVINSGSVIGGTTAISIQGTFESLTQSIYYYCIVAQNSLGTSYGSVKVTSAIVED